MLSIIIPVYNSKEYLEKCLNSVKDVSDSEIIIINDGSTDDSEKIINTYLEKYPNFTYYKKGNTGIADTRNFGIEHCKRRLHTICGCRWLYNKSGMYWFK